MVLGGLVVKGVEGVRGGLEGDVVRSKFFGVVAWRVLGSRLGR